MTHHPKGQPMTPEELRTTVARIIAGEADADTVDAGWYLADADRAIATVLDAAEAVCRVQARANLAEYGNTKNMRYIHGKDGCLSCADAISSLRSEAALRHPATGTTTTTDTKGNE